MQLSSEYFASFTIKVVSLLVVGSSSPKNSKIMTSGKIALFFGTEIDGLSDTILNEADEFVKIPMYGFTESFNISVSAAISMYELMKRLRESKIEWRLTAAELLALKLDWVKESVKSSDLLEKEFRKQRIAE